MGLKQKIKKTCKSAPAWAFGPHGPLYLQIQFKIRDRVQSGQDQFRLFPKSPDYKYVPFVIRKGRASSRLANNNLGASPPLILGFHPNKRHAALIVSRDQGSVVLTFTLVLLVLKHFLWRVMLVILMFVSWLLVDLLCFVAYHLRISCCLCAVTFQPYASSCSIELVAQRQHPTSFMSSRSNMLWFALISKSWRNICQIRPCKPVG